MDPRIKLATRLQGEELEAAGEAADAVRCFRLISLASQRLRHLFDQRLREEGLTMQQGILLSFVRTHGRPTLSEVARSMATSHQNAKQVALAVERKGYIFIEPDPADGRSKRLVPTALGKRGWRHRNKADFAAVASWFSALSPEEQKSLASMLGRLIRHMD